MPNITGGSVTFGEQRKLADYEGRKVDVTLTFAAPDNGTVSETDVQSILDMAERRVREKQSGQSVAIPTTASASLASPSSKQSSKSDKQKAAEAKTNGQSGAIDVVTATSGEVLRCLMELLTPAGRALARDAVLLVGGERLGREARRMGYEGELVVAESPESAALVAALGRWRARD